MTESGAGGAHASEISGLRKNLSVSKPSTGASFHAPPKAVSHPTNAPIYTKSPLFTKAPIGGYASPDFAELTVTGHTGPSVGTVSNSMATR